MSADKSVYRIRLIHGYHGGTALLENGAGRIRRDGIPRFFALKNRANPGIYGTRPGIPKT